VRKKDVGSREVGRGRLGMYLITGGAGFIGSNLVEAFLNIDRGIEKTMAGWKATLPKVGLR
jgi:hypothetical protein